MNKQDNTPALPEDEKLRELQKEHAALRDEVINLRNWKQETMRLLMPILEWGDVAMVPLGKSVTKECLERAKAYDALKEKAEAMAAALEKAENALTWCYDVVEFPADGDTPQDKALETVTKALTLWRGEGEKEKGNV